MGRAAAQAFDAANPDLGRLAEIEAEQRKLRNLRADLNPRDAAQIESVIAEHAPLARRLYAPRERRRFPPLPAQIPSAADPGHQRRAIPATPAKWSHTTQLR